MKLFIAPLLLSSAFLLNTQSLSAAEKPFLGVKPTPSDVESYLDEEQGIHIAEVIPNSTAAELGIIAGDIITQINGKKVRSGNDAMRILIDTGVGNDVSIQVIRNKETLELQGKLRGKAKKLTQKEIDKGKQSLEALGEEEKPENLAAAMGIMAASLNALPDRVDEAAKAFKALYPDGKFEVSIHLDISTDTKAKDPMTIKTGKDLEAYKIQLEKELREKIRKEIEAELAAKDEEETQPNTEQKEIEQETQVSEESQEETKTEKAQPENTEE